MMIEIPVTIQTDHDDPAKAYQQVVDILTAQPLGWESGDTWFHDDGSEVTAEEMSAAFTNAIWPEG